MAYGSWFHLYAISYWPYAIPRPGVMRLIPKTPLLQYSTTPFSRACGDFDMGLQRLVGSLYVPHDPPDQLIRRHPLGKRLIGEHEPVAKYIRHQIRHVLGQDISATAQECERT